MILFIKIFSGYTFLIIDVINTKTSGITYSTTKGPLNLKDYYDPGTLIIKYKKDAIKDIKIPFLSNILEFRKEYSARLFKESKSKLRLAQALIVGDRDFLTTDIKDKLIIAGVYHLLAISGLHVGIISTFCFLLLFFLPRKLKYLFIIIVLFFYMPLTGFKVPVIRASITGIFIMLLFIFDIKVNFKKFILLLAAIFIMINPKITTNISFILSFTATAGIIYLGFSNKNKTLNSFYISIAAQSVIMPISLYIFGMFNIASMLNTILLLPIINIYVMLGLLSLFFSKLLIIPLIYCEHITKTLINFLYISTYPLFTIYKIDLLLLIISTIFIIIIFYLPKARFSILLLYLLLLTNNYCEINEKNLLYLYDDNKNIYIYTYNDYKNYIYYKGNYNIYRYKLLPELAIKKIKSFEGGMVNVQNGENYYIKVKNISDNYICVNKNEKGNCKILYDRVKAMLEIKNSDCKYKIKKDRINAINYAY
ncbi:MAG: ComEC/Rec2 family competence protein [Deferribacterota bacterium]|nr:ComEC/Rec2 family competence protein [Deferribacterota bacterium]